MYSTTNSTTTPQSNSGTTTSPSMANGPHHHPHHENTDHNTYQQHLDPYQHQQHHPHHHHSHHPHHHHYDPHHAAYMYAAATTTATTPEQQQQQHEEYMRAFAYHHHAAAAAHHPHHHHPHHDPSMDAATQQYMIDAAAAAAAAAASAQHQTTTSPVSTTTTATPSTATATTTTATNNTTSNTQASSTTTTTVAADEEVKLFDGFSFALAYQPQDSENIWKMEDLKKKIWEHEGTFHDTLDDKVNIILVLSDHVVDTNRIDHAIKFSIPVVSEQYVYDCVNCNTRLDWSQYVVMSMPPPPPTPPTTTTTSSSQLAAQQQQQQQAHHTYASSSSNSATSSSSSSSANDATVAALAAAAEDQLSAAAAAAVAAAAVAAASAAAVGHHHPHHSHHPHHHTHHPHAHAAHLHPHHHPAHHHHHQPQHLNGGGSSSSGGGGSSRQQARSTTITTTTHGSGGVGGATTYHMNHGSHSSSGGGGGGSKPPNAKSNFQLKMYLKGSRQSMFTDQFPEVLYTLTWKHKYDVQIKATDKIFEGRSQSKIMDSLEVALVLSQTNEIPIYDEDDKKRKRKRSKSDEMDGDDDVIGGGGGGAYDSPYGSMHGLHQQQQHPSYGMPAGFTGIPTAGLNRGGGGGASVGGSNSGSGSSVGRTTNASAKKRPGSKNSNETVCVSSLHKSGDDEIVIRFGVNSTFCSKRFNYGAFKLYINYAPPDVSEDFHFTVYSAEFKTFVKKNANIAKYLHSPHPLNGVITVITKAMTQKIPVEYAKYMTADLPEAQSMGGGASSGGTSGSSQAAKKRQKSVKGSSSGGGSGASSSGGSSSSNSGNSKKRMKTDADESSSSDAMDAQMQAAAYSQQYSALALQNSMAFDPNYTMGFQYMQMMNPMAQYSHLTGAYMHGAAISPEGVAESSQQAAASAAAAASSSAMVVTTQEKYQWYGEPVGINVEGDIFYYSFGTSTGDEVYKIGEFVFLSPTTEDGRECEPAAENGQEDWDRLWICKIINLVHTKMEGMKMIGQWFYRSSDLHDSCVSVKHPNELFVSFDINYNQLNSIRGKCEVYHCTDPDSEENQRYLSENPQKHFFFRSGFNRLRGEVFELTESVLQTLAKGKTEGEDDIEEALGLHSAIMAHMEQQMQAYSMQAMGYDPSAMHAAYGIPGDGQQQ